MAGELHAGQRSRGEASEDEEPGLEGSFTYGEEAGRSRFCGAGLQRGIGVDAHFLHRNGRACVCARAFLSSDCQKGLEK